MALPPTGDQSLLRSYDDVVKAHQIQGPVAHDTVDTGNPMPTGGFATQDLSAEVDVAAGDRVRHLATLKGAQLTAGAKLLFDAVTSGYISAIGEADDERPLAVGLYAKPPDGLSDRLYTLGDIDGSGKGVLAAAPWIPGASDVLGETIVVTGTETTRRTLVTPTSGKKIRVLAVMMGLSLTADTTAEIYFGLGANLDTASTKVIARGTITRSESNDTSSDLQHGFPDGGGSVGAVDEVVSVRVANDNDYHSTVIYREE